MNPLIPIMVILPIACALLLNLLHGKDRTVKTIAIIVALAIPIIPLVTSYGLHYFGGHSPISENPTIADNLPVIIKNSIIGVFHPAIVYSFASAQKVMIFILGLLAFLAIFTSLSETRKPSGVYGFLMFMATAAVTAILLADDIFNLYVFFEIAAIAQAGIVIASDVKDNYETALKYLILGSIAGPLLLLGVALLLGVTGNVNITDIIYSMKHGFSDPQNPVFLTACALIIFAWLYGSGLPPFHTIKSALYSKALPHGAALLQAFSVFTLSAIGIIILRVFSYLPFSKVVMIVISIAAIVIGITMALQQTDYKRIIGYLAVGEIGYIGIGLGLGTAFGITAGLFQAVNEAICTAFLFIGCGAVLYKTGTTETSKLGGMMIEMPKVALLVLLAGFAISGIPPFNVFQSKLMLVQASLQSGLPEIAIIMVLMSIITFMAIMKAFYNIYMRPKPSELEFTDKGIPKATIISLVVLLVVTVILGIYPQIATNYLQAFAYKIMLT